MKFSQPVSFFLLIFLSFQVVSIDIKFNVPVFTYGNYDSLERIQKSKITIRPQVAKFAFAKKDPSSIVFVGDVLLARNVEYLSQKNGGDYPYREINFNDIAINPYVVGNFVASVPKEHVLTETLQLKFSVADMTYKGLVLVICHLRTIIVLTSERMVF